VLHVLPHPGGGGERYIDLLTRMAGFDHDRGYISSGKRLSALVLSLPKSTVLLARASARADLLHVHGDAAGAIALPLMSARPSVLTTHGLNLFRRLDGPRRVALEYGMTGVAIAAGAIICTSETEREELAPALRRADREKLVVIRNGVDPPPDPSNRERSDVREELGIDPQTVLGLFVGALDPNKAPLLAAAGAVEARSRGARFVLALAGDGPQRRELMALGDPAVRVLGYRTDVRRLLTGADVFVQTSEREGVPFSLLEAMIQGLPVVAASGQGTAEVVGESGLMVPVGDSDALATALVRLSGDLAMCAKLGRRARERAEDLFGVERFLRETRCAYERVLDCSFDSEP
jgi:glycosyltransferase involved in cell wall biosynthesis